MIVNAPEGQVTHYLYSPFGKTTYGRHYSAPPHISAIPGLKRMILYFPCADKASENWLAFPRSEVVHSWEGVLDKLKQVHGASAKVAVIPDATIQYFPPGA